MECGEAMGTGAALGQGPSASAALTDNPQARLTVVVEVERTRSGKKPPHVHLRSNTAWESLLGEGEGKAISLGNRGKG